MSETSPERPLVTFALFGYNQEQYIREAVEGAFSQTYGPLEIILSDDCSSDQTYEIMQEMAAAYEGPHKVIVRQNSKNMGTLSHVQQAVQLASGEFIVLAAGDDISRTNRVEILAASQQQHGSWGVFSDFAEIDAEGRITAEHKKSTFIDVPEYRLRSYMVGTVKENNIIHGATSAYSRALFEHLVLNEDSYILAEDGALSILLHILGEDVSYISEPLVEYRAHEGSLTNSANKRLSWAEIVLAEEKMSIHALSQSNRCDFILKSHRRLSNTSETKINENLVRIDRERQFILSIWWDMGPLQRFKSFAKNGYSFV